MSSDAPSDKPNQLTARRTGLITCCALLAYGLAQGILGFGHQIVPNPDFAMFSKVGEALLEFRLPDATQRGPLLGLAQHIAGLIVGGDPPALRGAWVVNMVLHAASLPIAWMLLRPALGMAAAPITLLAFSNPQVCKSLVQPLAETSLSFLILLTILLAARGSGWAWVTASLGALVRWDGLGLVIVAAVGYLGRSRQSSIHPSTAPAEQASATDKATPAGRFLNLARWRRCVLFTFLAALPTLAWGAWFTTRDVEQNAPPVGGLGQTRQQTPSYLADVKPDQVGLPTLRFLVRTTESVVFEPLFEHVKPEDGSPSRLWTCLRIVSAALVMAGVIRAARLRSRPFLLSMLYFGPYLLFLSSYWVVPRYVSTLSWLLLGLAVYGARGLLQQLARRGDRGRTASNVIQWSLVFVAAWGGSLILPELGRSAALSPSFQWMPVLAAIALIACTVGWLWEAGRSDPGPRRTVRTMRCARHACLSIALMTAALASSQYRLGHVLGDGHYDAEYVELARWFRDQPGEPTLVTRMPRIVAMYADQAADRLVSDGSLPLQTFDETLKICQRRGHDLVAVQIRRNLRGGEFLQFKLTDDQLLSDPASVLPWRLVHTIKNEQHRSRVEVWSRH